MLATEDDSVREYTRNVGFENQNQAWILSPFDTWNRNPFYAGPPVRHPEDYIDEDTGEDFSDVCLLRFARDEEFYGDDLPF